MYNNSPQNVQLNTWGIVMARHYTICMHQIRSQTFSWPQWSHHSRGAFLGNLSAVCTTAMSPIGFCSLSHPNESQTNVVCSCLRSYDVCIFLHVCPSGHLPDTHPRILPDVVAGVRLVPPPLPPLVLCFPFSLWVVFPPWMSVSPGFLLDTCSRHLWFINQPPLICSTVQTPDLPSSLCWIVQW